MLRFFTTLFVFVFSAFGAAGESWFGAPIPASGEKPGIDCGMTAAKIFDSPIPGMKRIGSLAVPKSAELPDSSNASIGFECIDRGLFDPDRCYDTLADTGIKWARCQTMWSRCEKEKGKYDFAVLDGIVDNLTKRGIRPWFSVSFGNTLYMTNCYTGAAVGCVPTLYGDECKAAWCAYVRELAVRYKGKVTHWEIWNEPNLSHFWQPSKPNAADYLELVKLTGRIIRNEIPDAKIGGTTASPALNKWEMEFFELGGAAAIDFWCGHAYTRVPELLRRQQRIASGSSQDYVTVLKDVRSVIDAHGGKHIAIWQGESGFPSWFPAGHWLWWPKTVCKEGWQSQANQAKWLLRRFVTDRRAGIVRSSFFQMADISRRYSMATTTQMHPAEHGIVNGWTYKPKMSCNAFGYYNALFATAKLDESAPLALSPAVDGVSPTVTATFLTPEGKSLFLYYTAFDFSGNYTGTCYRARCDAKLTIPAAVAPMEPVLVDMLRGGVYSVSSRVENDGKVTFSNLPLVDYPLVLADRSAVDLAPVPRVFPFAMEGMHLPEVWTPAGRCPEAGAGGFISAQGSDFIDASGKRQRFLGVNLYGPAALPPKSEAPEMAKRLARWGINAVRIFPQYAWQLRKDGDYSKGFDPDLLDRFDWLFYNLKKNGIYSDMNLHSARTAGYRFKNFKRTMKENKGLDNFDPTFILHQKEFIRDVFTHVNPYTGLAYNDDPAVMSWELNNECALPVCWFKMGLEDRLLPAFRRELLKQFNEWLRAKYGTTERLKAAWTSSSPVEPDLIPDGVWKDAKAFARMPWYTEGYVSDDHPRNYSFDESTGSVKFEAGDKSKFALTRVPLKKGQTYEVSFRIRSKKPGSALFTIGQHNRPYGNQGCRRVVNTGTNWTEVKIRTAALLDDDDNRVQWRSFSPAGEYEITGLSIVCGGELGLDPGESLEDGTIGFGAARSQMRTHDISMFILDVEDRYWKDLYAFAKHEMRAKAPVNCGTADYGAHYPQAYGDFIDDHMYYGGLVEFPGKSWDRSNWYCQNKSIVLGIAGDSWYRSFQRSFENRVIGKPFTVSEAGMMSQMATAAEYFPVIFSLAAFQNSAAIHTYTWSHHEDHSYGSTKFLDMRGNAKYLAHLPASYNMFVRGDVKNGEDEKDRIVYDLHREDERNEIVKYAYSRFTHVHDTDTFAFLKALTGRRLVDLKNVEHHHDLTPTPYGKPVEPCDSTVSSTGEIRWSVKERGREFYAVDTARTKFISMFGTAGTVHAFKDGFSVRLGNTLMGWAAISFTELSVGKWLLAATGYQQPTGVKLSEYGKNKIAAPKEGTKLIGTRITTMKSMGDLPYECEGVRATLRLPSDGRILRITPLNGDGRPLSESVDVQVSTGFAEFKISEKYRTIWYLVETVQ